MVKALGQIIKQTVDLLEAELRLSSAPVLHDLHQDANKITCWRPSWLLRWIFPKFQPICLSMRQKQHFRVNLGNIGLLQPIIPSLSIKLRHQQPHEQIYLKMFGICVKKL